MRGENLLFAVLFKVRFASFLRMSPGMGRVTARRMRVMGRFLVVSPFVLLGGFTVMVSGLGVMFGGLSMVLCCLFRHDRLPDAVNEKTRR